MDFNHSMNLRCMARPRMPLQLKLPAELTIYGIHLQWAQSSEGLTFDNTMSCLGPTESVPDCDVVRVISIQEPTHQHPLPQVYEDTKTVQIPCPSLSRTRTAKKGCQAF